ncbi:MAG: hypothetical protein V4702_00380 [Patescibacteria group bacterium]
MDKKLPKPKKKDRDWQAKIARNIENEKVRLDDPLGKEQFKKVISKISKKNS